MTETTVETYSIDGTVLNTLAYNISSLSGRSATPSLRGQNRSIPFRPGKSWVAKVYDERVETLVMWVLGCDVDGGFPEDHSRRAELNQNLDSLKRLFSVRHRLLVAEKVVLFPDGPMTFSAEVEATGTLDPQFQAAGTRAVFSVDLNFPDPFWYGVTAVEEEIFGGGGVITNVGSAVAQKMLITFEGPLNRPRLINDNGIEVRLDLNLAGGQSVTLDTDAFTAYDGTGVNRISEVQHVGSVWWMEFLPGDNTVNLDKWTAGGSLGAGSVTVSFMPPYV